MKEFTENELLDIELRQALGGPRLADAIQIIRDHQKGQSDLQQELRSLRDKINRVIGDD